MTNGIIYVTRCLVNGKVYVGLHTKGRKNYLGSGIILANAIKKHGRKNFKRTNLDTFLFLKEGQAKERCWIAALNSKRPNGYNLNDGGEGQFNPCQETRDKMSAARKGAVFSEKHRANLSASHIGLDNHQKGTRHTAESKDKMRANSAWKTTRRPEMAAKISAANKGKKNNLGHHHSDLTKSKIGAASRGRVPSETTRAKIREAMKGRHFSEESIPKRLLVIERVIAVLKGMRQGEGYWYTAAEVVKQIVHEREVLKFPFYMVEYESSPGSPKKMSAARMGMVLSESHRAQISASKKGKPWTEARRIAQAKRRLAHA